MIGVKKLNQIDIVISLALAMFVAVLFMAFLRPPALSDQLDYFYHASQLQDLGSKHRHLRVGIIWPTSILIGIFGYSEISYYALPLFSALSLSLGTWLLGRLLFSRATGIVAGLLVVCNQWVLLEVSHLLPDFLAAGLLTLSFVVLIYLGQDGKLNGKLSGSTIGLLVLSGVLLGWSYLAREYVFVLFPAALLLLLVFRSNLKHIAYFSIGALACWLAELIWGWLLYENPIIRFLAVSSPRQTVREFETSIWGVLGQLPELFLGASGGWLFVTLFLLALIVVPVCAVYLGGPWRILAAWFVAGWCFFTIIALLPMLLLGEDRVYLRMHKFRYWALILPPLFVGGVAVLGQTLNHLYNKLRKWQFIPVFLLCLFLVFLAAFQSVGSISRSTAFVRNGATDYLEFRSFIRSIEPSRKLWIDGRKNGGSALRSVPIYLSEWHGLKSAWSGGVHYFFNQVDFVTLEEIEGGVLVLDRTRVDFFLKSPLPPEYLMFPERYGTEIFRSTMGKMVVYDMSKK